MKEPILVMMAAGMGSRYGGLKQLDPVGPDGEVILDYSLYDAYQAGFRRVVFLIKHEIEDAFKAMVGSRVPAGMEANYAFQQLDKLPEGFSVPEGRVKPWGTGHAVLCCREFLDAPFLVINADDYYGAGAFKLAYEYLRTLRGKRGEYFMVGYALKNTLTENGYVSRGICTVDEHGYLTDLTERTHIERRDGQAMYTEDDGASWHTLPNDCPVSMNCWGFPAGAAASFEASFRAFLDQPGKDPLKAEFYLPSAVDAMVDSGAADVQVLRTTDRWYGMTYTADREQVTAAIRGLVDAGQYPEKLWE